MPGDPLELEMHSMCPSTGPEEWEVQESEQEVLVEELEEALVGVSVEE